MSDSSTDFQFNPPASDADLRALTQALKRELPEEYAEFLRAHDGGEGEVGEDYIILWRAAELVNLNEEYEVAKYAPGLFLFGSDGEGEAYAFDLRAPEMPIVKVPFVGMDLEYAEVVAENFDELF